MTQGNESDPGHHGPTATETSHDLFRVERRSAPSRLLWTVGLLEASSLVVLLTNLFTANNASVAQATGPIHGLLYLTGIALVWSNGFPTRSKLFVLIPAVGTLLATSAQARRY